MKPCCNRDLEVGRTILPDERPVYQCQVTGLLYCHSDPVKQYVSVTNVSFKEVSCERPAKQRPDRKS